MNLVTCDHLSFFVKKDKNNQNVYGITIVNKIIKLYVLMFSIISENFVYL